MASFFRKIHSIFVPKTEHQFHGWTPLLKDLKGLILKFAEDPYRTALINQECRQLSKDVYPYLITCYNRYSVLKPYLNKAIDTDPTLRVHCIYTLVIQHAKKLGIDPRKTAPFRHSFSPFCLAMLGLMCMTEEKNSDFDVFAKRVFYQAGITSKSGLYNVLDEVEFMKLLNPGKDTEDLFKSLRRLDLTERQLTHLPPQIGFLTGVLELILAKNYLTELPPEMCNLKRLAALSLKGNRLSPENVQNICQQLPALEIVYLYPTDQPLIQMFKQHFPHLNIVING